MDIRAASTLKVFFAILVLAERKAVRFLFVTAAFEALIDK